jgi:hypothetical protein
MDKFGFTEDQLAEYDRWTREGIPPSQAGWAREEVLAYMAAHKESDIRDGHGPVGLLAALRELED